MSVQPSDYLLFGHAPNVYPPSFKSDRQQASIARKRKCRDIFAPSLLVPDPWSRLLRAGVNGHVASMNVSTEVKSPARDCPCFRNGHYKNFLFAFVLRRTVNRDTKSFWRRWP